MNARPRRPALSPYAKSSAALTTRWGLRGEKENTRGKGGKSFCPWALMGEQIPSKLGCEPTGVRYGPGQHPDEMKGETSELEGAKVHIPKKR